MEHLKIKLISIKNFLGIKDLTIKPGGAITVIRGDNATGKTSTIEALKAAIGGGTDATLIRKGSSGAEVGIEFNDDMMLTRKITASGSTISLTHPEKGKIPKPQTFLNGIFDSVSFNPAEFLDAPPAKRAQILLESIPLAVTQEQISKALGYDVEIIPFPGEHALKTIERVNKAIYDDRTGLNRAAKEKRATISQLETSVPEETDITVLADELDALTSQKEDLTAQIANLQEQMSGLNTKAAIVRQKIEEVNRAEGARALLATLKSDADKLEEKSEARTKTIEDLKEFQGTLMESLPIPGLTLIDGNLYVKGVVIDRLNTAEQIKLAAAVTRVRAGSLGVIVLDGVERLSEHNFIAFCDELKGSGLQAFLTRVSEDAKLKIETA